MLVPEDTPEQKADRIDRLIHDAEAAEAGIEAARRIENKEMEAALTDKARRLRAESWVLLSGAKQPGDGTTGRPSKFTPTVICKFLEAISAGATYDIAASYAGIAESVFYDWQQRGTRGEAGYAEFSEAVHAREAAAAMLALQAWRGHFGTDFRAPRDFMARRFPASWSPTIKQQQIGPAQPSTGKLTIVFEGPQTAELQQALEAARSLLEPPRPMLEVTDVIDGTARTIEPETNEPDSPRM